LYCSRRGFPFGTAKDGDEAVRLFKLHRETNELGTSCQGFSRPFELVLMDLQMPVCDGVEATRQIRELERIHGWKKSIVTIVTGQDTATDRENASEAGSDWYLVKPVGPKILDRWMKQWFPSVKI